MVDFEKILIGLLADQNPASHSEEFKRSLWEELRNRVIKEEYWEVLQERMCQKELQEKQHQEELDSADLDMVAAGVRSQKNVKKALFDKGEKL